MTHGYSMESSTPLDMRLAELIAAGLSFTDAELQAQREEGEE